MDQTEMNRIAATKGHPRRYEAMLLLNALALHRPLFESALKDPDPKIRSAAYSSFAIHGQLKHLIRLAEGLDDPSSEVREHVIALLLEHLQGSDIDKRKPLMKRKWKKSEQAVLRTFRSHLTERFKQLARSSSATVRADAASGLAFLAPSA